MTFSKSALLATTLSLLASIRAQQAGTQTAEIHPSLSWQKCTKSGGCTTQSSGKVVLDANWRWVHTTSGYTNCYTGNAWDASLCPDGATCAANCALDGADYSGTYGITTSGNELSLKFVTGSNNQEFTFDVDASQLPCGVNGALYFPEVDADGGMSKYPSNKAGAKYGTGYCDTQCPRDIKFINGEANVEGWAGLDNDPNSGTGNYGTCCTEMDVWEANSISTAYTSHPCTSDGQYRCAGDECTTICDQAGRDFNSFRMGGKSFYGTTVDPKQKMTVVTRFFSSDN